MRFFATLAALVLCAGVAFGQSTAPQVSLAPTAEKVSIRIDDGEAALFYSAILRCPRMRAHFEKTGSADMELFGCPLPNTATPATAPACTSINDFTTTSTAGGLLFENAHPYLRVDATGTGGGGYSELFLHCSGSEPNVSGFEFACPAEQELCEFITSNPDDTNCDLLSGPPQQGWNFVDGTDATLCDNQQFNGHIPDEVARLDRPVGFWTHNGTTEIAEMTAEVCIVGAGIAAAANGPLLTMLRSTFSLLCSLSMDDIAVTDPAQLVLNTSTGSQDIGHTVTSGDCFRVVVQYDPGAGDDCEVWIDPINGIPRIGALANSTRATQAPFPADVLQVRNSLGANLVIIKSVAACPDGCTYVAP